MKLVSRSSNKEEGKTHKGKIPPSNEGAYKTIAKAAKNGMTRHLPPLNIFSAYLCVRFFSSIFLPSQLAPDVVFEVDSG